MPTETTQTDTEADGHPDAHSHKQTCTTHTKTHTIQEHVHSRASPQKKCRQTQPGKNPDTHICTSMHAQHIHRQTHINTYCGLHKHMGTTQISTHITHRHRGVQIDIHLHPWGWVEETALGETLFPLRLLPKGISLEGCGDLLLNTQCCTVPVQGCYPKHLLDPHTLPFLYSSSSHSCSSS